MNADDAHACEVLSGDHGCRGVLISVERYQQLVDDAAGFASARARADDLRRQLDERDAEFAAVLHRWNAERADEKYLRCEACGHEESEPFAPGDSHAGCDGPLFCVTCGTGIATPRAEPDEAGPLVDVVGRILRDAIDHEPDFRRGAERIAAEVARRLPTARELADGYLPFVWSQSDCYARAANILSAIRTRLGLDPQAPPGRAEPDDAMVERLAEANAMLSTHARQLREWLTNAEEFPCTDTIDAMWAIADALDPEDEAAPPSPRSPAERCHLTELAELAEVAS